MPQFMSLLNKKKTIVSKLVSVISSLQIQGDRVFGQHSDGPPPLHGPVVPRGNLAHLNRTHNANTLRHETHGTQFRRSIV